MEFNVYGGQRVLCKINGSWKTGNLVTDGVYLRTSGLFFDVENYDDPANTITYTMVPYDNLFIHARKLEDWETTYLYNKENFLQAIEDEEISSKTNNAWMSDGEYVYYTVGKWNKNWLDKQPFEYVYCV